MVAVKQANKKQDGFWEEGPSVLYGWKEQIPWVCSEIQGVEGG